MTAFDKVEGYSSIKAELSRYCDSFKNPEKYQKLGVKAPRGILLYGEPGIGKSLMTECFAEECGCHTYTIRKQYSDGKFLEHIMETFQEACENAPSIVILDDLDKFSNSSYQYRNTDEYVAVQSGIDECKKYDVFVLATANDIEFLPESLIRAERFDRIIEMQEPCNEDAKKILTSYLKKTELSDDVDIDEILVLLSGRTCAELEKVVNDAGISAAYAGRDKISYEDLFNACVRLITGEPDNMDPCAGKNAALVAIHEAGHVVVSEYWKRESVNLSSIVGTSYRIAGVTSHIKDDEKVHSVEDVVAEVSVMLGGKAASEIMLGFEDCGCGKDIHSAYNLARTTVAELCWQDFGTITQVHDSSETNRTNRDDAIRDFLVATYKVTMDIIYSNKTLVRKIAKALLEKTTITYKDIRSICMEEGWGANDSNCSTHAAQCRMIMETIKNKPRKMRTVDESTKEANICENGNDLFSQKTNEERTILIAKALVEAFDKGTCLEL